MTEDEKILSLVLQSSDFLSQSALSIIQSDAGALLSPLNDAAEKIIEALDAREEGREQDAQKMLCAASNDCCALRGKKILISENDSADLRRALFNLTEALLQTKALPAMHYLARASELFHKFLEAYFLSEQSRSGALAMAERAREKSAKSASAETKES